MSKFSAISEAFTNEKSNLNVSEVHGFLSGILSAGAQMNGAQLARAFEQHFDCSLS